MKINCSNLKNFMFLLKAIWQHGKIYTITTIAVSLIISPINSIASVLFTKTVINAVARGESFKHILTLILMFVLILLITNIIQSVFTNLYKTPKWSEISQEINYSIYDKVRHTDYEYFDNPEFYDNYTWAINEYSRKSNEANALLQSICRAVSTITSMTAMIAVLGPGLIILTIFETCATIAIEFKRNKIGLEKQEKLVPLDRKIGYVQKIYYHREYAADVRSTQLANYLDNIYIDSCKNKNNIIKDYAKKLIKWINIQNIMNVLYNALIISYICYNMVVKKNISGIGNFTGLITANSQLMNSIYELFGFITKMNNLGLYASKIKLFFSTESKIEIDCNKKNKISNESIPFKIDINNVSFSYKNSNFGLKNINITALAGETIAIVGANGAGKSTLVKLLLGLYEVDTGEILINDKCIHDYNLKKIRSKIGVVFQNTNIYAFSVYDNISLYERMSIDVALDTLNELNLRHSLECSNGTIHSTMTKEFDSQGIVLSGGEYQKLALARVMNSNVGVLLLDEPSSALDPIAEYEMMNLLLNKAPTVTKIIIAHRLSTIRNANRIYLLDKGTIKEVGTHQELMDKKGLYYKMFNKQAEGYL